MRSGPPRRSRKASKNVGVEKPHIFEGFPGPPGRPDFKNDSPKIRPDCLQVPSYRNLVGSPYEPGPRVYPGPGTSRMSQIVKLSHIAQT